MILILSDSGDISTDYVIDWLNEYKSNYCRVNSTDFINDRFLYSDVKDNSLELIINETVFDISKFHSIWFRKFGFFQKTNIYKTQETIVDAFTLGHTKTEFFKVLETFELALKNKFWLTHPSKIRLNKPYVINLARKNKLQTPRTYIVNRKEDLVNIMNKHEVISKSIFDPLSAKLNNKRYMMYTTLITCDDLYSIPNEFFPSLIQEKIDKQFEIRTFYLDGKCYSMAIMSQNDAQTELDFRKYNWNNPNRFIPFRLPIKIEKQIHDLMTELELNTGSLDFILGKDGVLYFLEINPTGQFGMIDFSCNYDLHKKVAEILLKNDYER